MWVLVHLAERETYPLSLKRTHRWPVENITFYTTDCRPQYLLDLCLFLPNSSSFIPNFIWWLHLWDPKTYPICASPLGVSLGSPSSWGSRRRRTDVEAADAAMVGLVLPVSRSPTACECSVISYNMIFHYDDIN